MRKKFLSVIICCVMIGLVGCSSGNSDVKTEVLQTQHNITEKSERFNEKTESLIGWGIGTIVEDRVILKGKKDLLVLEKDGEGYRESKVINLNDYKLAMDDSIYTSKISYSKNGKYVLLYNQGKDITKEYSDIYLIDIDSDEVVKLDREDIYENEKDYLLYVSNSGDIYGSDEKNFKLTKANNYNKEIIKSDGYIVGVKEEEPILFDEENKKITVGSEVLNIPDNYTMNYVSNEQIFFTGRKDALVYSFNSYKLNNIPVIDEANAFMHDIKLSEDGKYMLSMQTNSLVRNKETLKQVVIPNTNISDSSVDCGYIDNENILVVKQIFGSNYGEYELYKYNHLREEEVKLEIK